MLEKIIMYPERCRACHRCEVACIAAHHNLNLKDAMKRRNEFVARVRVIKGEGYKTTVRCHECSPAPCVNICPTGALQQIESGEIVMKQELCLACEMCVDACPYGAVQMDTVDLPMSKVEDNPDDKEFSTSRHVAVRCDLCREWRQQTGKPYTACMEACAARAVGLQIESGEIIFPPKPEKKVPPKPAGEVK